MEFTGETVSAKVSGDDTFQSCQKALTHRLGPLDWSEVGVFSEVDADHRERIFSGGTEG